MEQAELEQQIERCRRLASQTTDNDLRHSLERLAQEYETKLHRETDSFMLGSASPQS